ncbi:MAG: acetylxylan esterase, partial [Alistipes sp.]
TLKQARTCELKPRITLLPERCTAKSNVYHVSFNNDREDSRIYGILSIPKGKGCHPAILNVPGAGCRPYEGDTYLADDGFISLTIGIHGIPVTLDKEVYDALFKAGLDRYWEQDLYSRDLYYYKRVYTGAVRAVDYIFTLPEFDGKRIAVSGGSQGGALSIIVAALDPRVTCYTSFYPALCDVTAYLHGRAAGWPAMFKGKTMADKGVAECAETALYYSTTNFARLLKCPGFYSWGYNDQVCPPSSVYATYNSVSAPKEKYLCYDTGHWNYPEQWACKQAFIKRIFNIKK